MIYIADDMYDAQCVSKFQITDGHTGWTTDGVPSCSVCIKPMHNYCCCPTNCFSFDWPGFTEVDAVCWTGGDKAVPINLSNSQDCNDGTPLASGAVWGYSGYAGGVTAGLAVNGSTCGTGVWTLTISMCTSTGSVVLTYKDSLVSPLTCTTGSTFTLDTTVTVGTCAVPTFPATLDVEPSSNCSDAIDPCDTSAPIINVTKVSGSDIIWCGVAPIYCCGPLGCPYICAYSFGYYNDETYPAPGSQHQFHSGDFKFLPLIMRPLYPPTEPCNPVFNSYVFQCGSYLSYYMYLTTSYSCRRGHEVMFCNIILYFEPFVGPYAYFSADLSGSPSLYNGLELDMIEHPNYTSPAIGDMRIKLSW